ncbi:hypothetical protein WG904_09930 [Pedobacter sp. Du54]|uniref:hypothetical protein n=1 Tax=Pedobacter anseongensis TaxID=3133439 RepID=UPI00309D83D3
MEKKSAFIVICVLLAVFAIYVYKYPPVKREPEKASTLLKMDGVEPAPSKLRMSLIEEMVGNYRKAQLLSIENSPKNPVKDDSYSILFDLDTLKQFISYIEQGVKQVDPSANPKLAIRMYYAAYPVKEKWSESGYENLRNLLGNDIPKLYERKHTLIMIPVIKTEKGIFADFNPFNKNTYGGFPGRAMKTMSLLREPSDTTEIPALNHGQLIPPASIAGEAF